jgi:hypothetical protein
MSHKRGGVGLHLHQIYMSQKASLKYNCCRDPTPESCHNLWSVAALLSNAMDGVEHGPCIILDEPRCGAR